MTEAPITAVKYIPQSYSMLKYRGSNTRWVLYVLHDRPPEQFRGRCISVESMTRAQFVSYNQTRHRFHILQQTLLHIHTKHQKPLKSSRILWLCLSTIQASSTLIVLWCHFFANRLKVKCWTIYERKCCYDVITCLCKFDIQPKNSWNHI